MIRNALAKYKQERQKVRDTIRNKSWINRFVMSKKVDIDIMEAYAFMSGYNQATLDVNKKLNKALKEVRK